MIRGGFVGVSLAAFLFIASAGFVCCHETKPNENLEETFEMAQARGTAIGLCRFYQEAALVTVGMRSYVCKREPVTTRPDSVTFADAAVHIIPMNQVEVSAVLVTREEKP